MRHAARSTALLFLLVATVAGTGALPRPAGAGTGSGAAVLSASPTSLPANGTTTITVTGRDYLVPPHGPGVDVFGGVYVLFGWAAGAAWGPSNRNSSNNNGAFGSTYSYPGDGGDASTRDDGTGRVRFVSFTAGGMSGEATQFHMDANGNWSTTLTVRSSTFSFIDPATGDPKTVNCQQVRCGVLTIGAHGKASATNERFVPVTFTGAPAIPPPAGTPGAGGAVVPSADPSQATSPGSASTAEPGPDANPAPTTAVTGPTASSTLPDTGGSNAAGTQDDPIALDARPASSRESTTVWPILVAAGSLLVLGGATTWWWRRRARVSQ
jgi:hypothetical protein